LRSNPVEKFHRSIKTILKRTSLSSPEEFVSLAFHEDNLLDIRGVWLDISSYKHISHCISFPTPAKILPLL